MAYWYVSSAVYAGLTAWQATTTVSVGTIWVPTAPAAGEKFCFRASAITTGTTGSTQPSWPTTNGGTVVDGGVTWTNVSGQSTYGWTASAGTLGSIFGAVATSRTSAGDIVFVSSDHAETGTAATQQFTNSNSTAANPIQVLSVNRLSGNVPPIASDITSGASISFVSGTVSLDAMMYFSGITFNFNGIVYFANGSQVNTYFYSCSLVQTSTSTSAIFGTINQGKITLDNTVVTFASTSQGFYASTSYSFQIDWKNTASAIGGSTLPATLFSGNGTGGLIVSCKGVDFSALGASQAFVSRATVNLNKVLLANCKLNASAEIVAGTPSASVGTGPVLELSNCDSSGTNYRCERHTREGDLTTDTTNYLSGGASNGTTSFSRKVITTAYCSSLAPFEGFVIDVWNTLISSSHTVTIQVISSTTLTNAQVWAEVEYLADSGDPMSGFASSAQATPLTSAGNLPSSGATWSSPPATPVTQEIQVSFTALQVGLLRVRVKCASHSLTFWYDPVATIA